MARPYRIEMEDGIYHVYSRGNRRSNIFEDNKDKKRLLEFLVRGKEKFDYHVLGYVLMTNHYHILIQTRKANLSKVMHYVNSSYANYYNYVHRKNGHLFQGRYKSILVEYDGYLLMELESDDEILKQIYGGSILGSIKFTKDVLRDLKIKIDQEEYSFRSKMDSGKINNNIDIENIAKIVSDLYNVEKDKLFNNVRKKMKERKIGIYLSKIMTENSNREIAKKFGISSSGVSKVFSRIEEDVKKDKTLMNQINTVLSLVRG